MKTISEEVSYAFLRFLRFDPEWNASIASLLINDGTRWQTGAPHPEFFEAVSKRLNQEKGQSDLGVSEHKEIQNTFRFK